MGCSLALLRPLRAMRASPPGVTAAAYRLRGSGRTGLLGLAAARRPRCHGRAGRISFRKSLEQGGALMPQTDWRLSGEWIKNCNCAFGCPCDFNARPTNGTCKGVVGMHIRQGHFGDVRLDGLNFAVTVDFPGPLHEGNGTNQAIIDERATPEQREA